MCVLACALFGKAALDCVAQPASPWCWEYNNNNSSSSSTSSRRLYEVNRESITFELCSAVTSPPHYFDYSPQITSWSPQGMRVLRQYKVPRAEVMFVTIQRENIRPSKIEMNKAVTMLPYCPMFAVMLWITTSPYRWPVRSFPSTCLLCTPPPPRTALRTFTPRRNQLVICGQYTCEERSRPTEWDPLVCTFARLLGNIGTCKTPDPWLLQHKYFLHMYAKQFSEYTILICLRRSRRLECNASLRLDP
jgi:hypothetical protein